MNNEDKKHFITSDFYAAAFCLAKGLKLLSVDWNNPHRASFVFRETENREGLVEDFLYGRALIEPKSFVAGIKQLKELLHHND